jgi:hypothetical protein
VTGTGITRELQGDGNVKDLARVSVLVGSKSVELTIAIAKHLSETGKLIQIYSDAQLYEARKAAASFA